MSYNDDYEAMAKEKAARMKQQRRFMIGGIFSAIVIVILIVVTLMSTTKIKPGYAGVIYKMNGGVSSTVLKQGWHMISPTENVTSYPVSTETVFLSKNGKEGSKDDESFDINSKSGKAVNVDVSYAYHMDAAKLPEIFTKFRGQDTTTIEDNFIRRSLKSSINNISSQYEVMDIYGGSRPELQTKVMEVFSKDMAQYGIIVESFNFLRITPDQASMAAIQQKVDAEQKLATAMVLQNQAKVDADTAKIKAEGDANAKLATAQGEAKSNAALQASLTDKLVEYKKLEVAEHQADAMAKWNVNTYITGSGATPFLNLPASTTAPAAK